MSRTNFVKSTMILLVTSVIIKILGFIYQIIIVRLVGTEPIGVLNMVAPIYSALTIIVTAGLPMAISKMVSEEIALNNYSSSFKIVKVAYGVVAVLAIVVFALTIILTPYLFEHLHSDERLRWCFYILLPGIIFVPISSILRGYFQGLQEMYYTSLAQLVEQIIRFTIGIIIIVRIQSYGIKFIAMGLAAAMIIGELIGLMVIICFYKRKKKKILPFCSPNDSLPGTFAVSKKLFKYGIPTTLSKLVSTLASAAEASIVTISLLNIGYNNSQAASIYGQFTGVAITLITIPTVLTYSLATSLLPAVSEAEAKEQGDVLSVRISEALRLTYIFCLPVIVVLFLKATSLSELLFDLPEAGITVRYLTFGAIFMYLAQTSSGIVQGFGLTGIILKNNILASIIKLGGIYYLTSIQSLNINGTALAYVMFYAVQCILNLNVITKRVKIKFKRGQLFLPIVNAILMVVNLLWTTRLLADFFVTEVVTIFSIVISGLIYLFILMITKQFSFRKIKR